MKKKLSKEEEILQLFRSELYKRTRAIDLLKKRTVLDIGCGDGEDAINLSKYVKNIVGIDIIKSNKWKDNTVKNVSFRKSSAERLPFKAKTFNGLFLKDVLHHVNDIGKTLKEIKRVTTSDAKIILIEGNRYNPIFYLYATKIHNHQHLTQKQLELVIKKHFPRATFLYVELYPPFLLRNVFIYKHILLLQEKLNKLSILKPFFSYNIAIIEIK